MKNLLTWVSATLWISVLGLSLVPLWRKWELKFAVLPCVLAATAVAQVFKLRAMHEVGDATANWPVFATDILAVLAVAGYTMCMSRLTREQARYEQLANEEKRAREDADAERAIAASVLQRVNDSFFSLDLDWKFTFVSREASRLMQGEPESFLGRTVWSCFPGTVSTPFEAAYREAFSNQNPIFIEAKYEPWNRWFENRIYPSPEGLSVFFHDITERKLAETQLRSAKIQLGVAIAASNIGVWDWNIEDSEVNFSPEWKSQLGYQPDELQDSFEAWESRIHPEDRRTVLGRLNQYLENSSDEFESEARLLHKDGTYRWILTRGELERDSNGRPSRMRGCHIDITERKRVEEELKKSQRELRALGAHLEHIREQESARIARELHDELGQALTALKLDLKWITERLPPDSDSTDPLSARLSQAIVLANDTIKSVRRICLELRPALLDQLGLPTAIEWQAKEFETRTGVPVTVSVAQELANLDPTIATALFRISQEALTNVARHADASHVGVRLVREKDRVELCIRDNGKGLSQNLSENGHGFGMLGMRERAMAIGGEVKVLSSPEAGVTLCVSVPLGAPPTGKDRSSSPPDGLRELPSDCLAIHNN